MNYVSGTVLKDLGKVPCIYFGDRTQSLKISYLQAFFLPSASFPAASSLPCCLAPLLPGQSLAGSSPGGWPFAWHCRRRALYVRKKGAIALKAAAPFL